ncbi:MAG: lipid-binding protein [Flavobacteriales bacterium]|mgnify:FL=1|nr:lipid-binding protein [Flavobacteriales bacterium]MBU46644.1 lipid-binding protein [Flavobacteriales bacterium]|tara:strand:- start:4930 stop:5523 length:594 start_codon:yes stop_codon:yes gene_type:complete
MKKILLSLTLSLITLFVFATKPHIENVRIDSETSKVEWIGSKVASSHEGNVNISKGFLSIDHGTLVGGEIAIDMNSISCSDIKSEKKNKYLVDHLKDEDFFHTAKFPLATIKIIRAETAGENSYKILADLTIKGITHPIAFQAHVRINGKDLSARANIRIDRTKWDIRYGSGTFFEDLGDKMILDEIKFNISLLSVK